jgi:hypothetical protein
LSNYNHRGTFSYNLYLHPNLLFADPVIHGEDGGHYFKNITDSIDVTFAYHFFCEPPANVTGTLQTNVTLLSVASRDGTVLWQKALALLSPSLTPFHGSEITVQIPFDLDTLYTLIEQIEQQIKVYSSEYLVTLGVSLHTIAETGVGVIDEAFQATMAIHLSDTVITIEPGLIQEKPGSIEHVTTMSFPWVNNWRVGAIIILGVLTVATGYYIPIYRRTMIHRGRENLVKKILNKYDDLIISLTQTASMPQAAEKPLMRVETIDDLHKIADQTSKPIFYTQNPTHQLASNATHVFFIHDTDMIYTLPIDAENPDPQSKSHDSSPSVASVPNEATLSTIQTIMSKIQPLLVITGVLLVGAVLWLTVYEALTLSRDLSSIFLGPRSLLFDLGIGLRVIHYLGIGVGCCIGGSWTLLKKQALVLLARGAR